MARARADPGRDLRAAAVAAAIEMLADRRCDQLRLADIAAAIGCRAPALYHHFRDRAALLRAVHDAGFERLCETKLAAAAAADGNAVERLRRGGHAYLAFAIENPGLHRLMFSDSVVPGEPLARDQGAGRWMR